MKSSSESLAAKSPSGAYRLVAKSIDRRLARMQDFAAERDDFNAWKSFNDARRAVSQEFESATPAHVETQEKGDQ